MAMVTKPNELADGGRHLLLSMPSPRTYDKDLPLHFCLLLRPLPLILMIVFPEPALGLVAEGAVEI